MSFSLFVQYGDFCCSSPMVASSGHSTPYMMSQRPFFIPKKRWKS